MNVGVLGHGALASIDDRGAVTSGDVALDWWVGADDRWHIPADEAATRQQRHDFAPVYDTMVRAPGGDVVQRVYGATAGGGAVVVVEVANESPAPLTVVLVVRIARRGVVEIDDSVLRIDGMPVLVLPRAPRGWAAGETTMTQVVGGHAQTGPMPAVQGPIELALLYPVPHGTSVRAALGAVSGVGNENAVVDVRDLPDAHGVARGWERQLDRGLQAALPSPVGDFVDAARADLLLASFREPAVVAALEDWGFDDEASTGWSTLRWSARRSAARRVSEPDPWPAVRSSDAAGDPAGFLSALRRVLVHERSGVIELLPGFPPDWLGQSLTVDAVPLRRGSLSFAVRWHGARPALLWEAPSGFELRAPKLDPAWSSNASAGETLLAEPPAALLSMGTRERSAGESMDAPGQFS